MNSAWSTARKVVRRETKSSLHAQTRSQYNLFERLQDEGPLEDFMSVRSADRSPHRPSYGTMDRRNSAPTAAEQAAALENLSHAPGAVADREALSRTSSTGDSNSARNSHRLPPTAKQIKTNARDLTTSTGNGNGIENGIGNGTGNGNGVAANHSLNNYSNDFTTLSPVSSLTSVSTSTSKPVVGAVSVAVPPFLSTKSSSRGGVVEQEIGWWFSPQIDFAFFWETLCTNRCLSSMLLFIPLGIISGVLEWSPTYTFVFNFLGIIPLAWLLGEATEELAIRTNQTIGGLLNATFGNAVELIVSVVALDKGMISLVQTSLLGSILSNLLLVLGTSFLLGGLYYPVQNYNRRGAHIFSSLLLLACISIAIPASFMNAFSPQLDSLLLLSRITAAIIFSIYLLYLYFQLYSHAHVFDDEKDKKRTEFSTLNVAALNAIADSDTKSNGENHAILADAADEDDNDDDTDDADEQANMSGLFAVFLLAAVTVLVSVCSEYLVDSIQYVTSVYHIPQAFVGVILLPIVSNAAEHTTAVMVAMKNKMDLSIGVAIGSSTQIALFLIPFCTLLAWVIDQPMTLNFTVFDTVVMTFSVIIVNFVVKNGESNWLEGCLLIGAYIIIGTAYFFHPSG